MNLIFTPTGAAAISFLDMPVGAHRNAGSHRYREVAAEPGPRDYEWQDINAPAVDGQDEKLHGFRELILGPFRVMYVADDYVTCAGLAKADRSAMEGKEVSVEIPTDTFPGCVLKAGSPKDEVPHESEAGNYNMMVEYYFTNKRLT